MSAHRRITAGTVALTAGVVVGCVQAWLAVSGRAPALSGLSLLALGLGGLGAGLMLTADGGPDPAGVGAAPAPRGPAGASGATASAPTPETAVDDVAVDGGDALAQAARIVDGVVAGEAEAVVDRIHGQPHSHLRLVLSPEDGPGDDDPEMLCELTAPLGAMGLAVGTLAQLMHDPHHVAEILEHLAHGGDASAASLLESLTSDGGEW